MRWAIDPHSLPVGAAYSVQRAGALEWFVIIIVILLLPCNEGGYRTWGWQHPIHRAAPGVQVPESPGPILLTSKSGRRGPACIGRAWTCLDVLILVWACPASPRQRRKKSETYPSLALVHVQTKPGPRGRRAGLDNSNIPIPTWTQGIHIEAKKDADERPTRSGPTVPTRPWSVHGTCTHYSVGTEYVHYTTLHPPDLAATLRILTTSTSSTHGRILECRPPTVGPYPSCQASSFVPCRDPPEKALVRKAYLAALHAAPLRLHLLCVDARVFLGVPGAGCWVLLKAAKGCLGGSAMHSRCDHVRSVLETLHQDLGREH